MEGVGRVQEDRSGVDAVLFMHVVLRKSFKMADIVDSPWETSLL